MERRPEVALSGIQMDVSHQLLEVLASLCLGVVNGTQGQTTQGRIQGQSL